MAETKKNLSPALIFLAIALIIVGIFTVKFKSNLSELETTHQKLKTEFGLQEAELEQIQTENKDLQAKLSDQNNKITDLTSEIKKMIEKDKLSVRQLRSLTRKIRKLDGRIADYKKRIGELEEQVATLTEDKKVLTEKNKNLDDENIDLKDKVSKASEIKAIGFNVKMTKKPGLFGSQDKLSNNAKKVNKIAITFFLQNNFLAENGPKELFISVIKPDSAVFTDKKLSAGEKEFSSETESKKIKYTQVLKFTYSKDKPNRITTMLQPEGALIAGKYTVVVYDGLGNIISDSSSFNFTLNSKGK